MLLGEADGVAYRAVRGDLAMGDDPAEWTDLRTAGAALDALGTGLFSTAAAVLNWPDQARFCTRDGTPMTSAVADPALSLVPADGEIAEAMWVTRTQVRAALGRGD